MYVNKSLRSDETRTTPRERVSDSCQRDQCKQSRDVRLISSSISERRPGDRLYGTHSERRVGAMAGLGVTAVQQTDGRETHFLFCRDVMGRFSFSSGENRPGDTQYFVTYRRLCKSSTPVLLWAT